MEKLVRLPTDEPKIVVLYLQWLYTFALPHPKFKQRGVWESLVELYVFGEKVQDDTLKNRIVDIFITGWTHASDCRWLSYAYTRLSEDAAETTPLRRLVVDLFAYGDLTGVMFAEEKDNLSKEACFEITMAMLKKGESLGRRALYLADCCSYHEHEAPAVEELAVEAPAVEESAVEAPSVETADVSVRYQLVLPITWLTGETH